MLKLFRQIRKRLLNENRFSKYLLYAVGEIFLVFIGILIAIQINNLNEDHKTGLKADIFRDKLKNDLEMDIRNIESRIENGIQMQNDIETYFDDFDGGRFQLDSLIVKSTSVPVSFFRYFPINYTFQDMQESGSTTLLSEEDRTALIELSNSQEFL